MVLVPPRHHVMCDLRVAVERLLSVRTVRHQGLPNAVYLLWRQVRGDLYSEAPAR